VDKLGVPLPSSVPRIYGSESSTNIPHSHNRTSQGVAHVMHPAVYHDKDNIVGFRRKPCVHDRWDYYLTSPYRASTQLMSHTFIQHDGTRQLTQWLRKQGHLALSDIQRQFPIIPHFIRLLRWGILDRSQYRRKRPPATLPSSLSSTGVRWRHSGAKAGV
jgi:hypothetical protein